MRISTPVLAVCGFVCAVSTLGAFAPGRQAPASSSLQRPPDVPRTFTDPAAYVPSLDDLAAATSELRDVVARFNADRQAIQRFYTIPGSKERRARLRAFHEAWLAALPKVSFDTLSRKGRSTTSCSGTTSSTSRSCSRARSAASARSLRWCRSLMRL